VKLGTIAWNGSSSAAYVDGARVFPVRTLSGRNDAVDVTALITRPLSNGEVSQLLQTKPVEEPVKWLPPILRPPKNVLCVGKNYVEHAKEGAKAEGLAKAEIPTAPIWFSKPHTTLVGQGGAIVHDAAFTSMLDYEAELAVVIARTCRSVVPERALDYVFGYTILNDVTARDVQQGRKQWFRGKSADTYGPCGPWIVTADEIPDPQRLAVRTTVNGGVRQNDTTANMIFDVRTLIADLSVGITLEAGDIIATGTPAGVAWGMDEPKYLQPGDAVVVEIENIGQLHNTVTARG
jgi:2-keto-4-pentenoate hydratase/2-oxohepta-3-ene-1,7-dioic acid hydratase in catechol pathway